MAMPCPCFSMRRSRKGCFPFLGRSTNGFTQWRAEMLRALVESAARFEDLPPAGYERVKIRWVIDLCQGAAQAALTGPFEIEKFAPVRGERSGKVSESNLKPAQLVDNAKRSEEHTSELQSLR